VTEYGGDPVTPFCSPGGLAVLGRFTQKRQGTKDIPARSSQPTQF
jgi:hypothetical protein